MKGVKVKNLHANIIKVPTKEQASSFVVVLGLFWGYFSCFCFFFSRLFGFYCIFDYLSLGGYIFSVYVGLDEPLVVPGGVVGSRSSFVW